MAWCTSEFHPNDGGTALSSVQVAASVVEAPITGVAGGDFFQQVPGEGCVWLAIGDVMGHGSQAHEHRRVLSDWIRARLPDFASPKEALTHIARELYPYLRQYRTLAALALIALGPGGGAAASAGQCPPLYVPRDGTPIFLSVRGLILGAAPNWHYDEATFPWQRGDRLLLFTDGLVEAAGREGPLGYEALRTVCQAADEAWDAESLLRRLRRLDPTLVVRDDLTLVSVTSA